MSVSSSLEGLRSLFGVSSAAPAATPAKSTGTSSASGFEGDLATLSGAGSQVSQSANNDGVRLDKVASIQSALAAGTYNVPASAVASRVIDSLLGSH
jgi:negative regulator of flagellin synthesis FlgM